MHLAKCVSVHIPPQTVRSGLWWQTFSPCIQPLHSALAFSPPASLWNCTMSSSPSVTFVTTAHISLFCNKLTPTHTHKNIPRPIFTNSPGGLPSGLKENKSIAVITQTVPFGVLSYSLTSGISRIPYSQVTYWLPNGRGLNWQTRQQGYCQTFRTYIKNYKATKSVSLDGMSGQTIVLLRLSGMVFCLHLPCADVKQGLVDP